MERRLKSDEDAIKDNEEALKVRSIGSKTGDKELLWSDGVR